MARRTGIGMALGAWLGGRPDINPAANATDNPETGELYDAQGNNVTDQANKYGTGVVKTPGLAMRLFNPDAAAQADQMNLQFNAKPAEAQQQFQIESQQAEDVARHAIAYARGIDPKAVDPAEVRGVVGARGLSIKQGGVTPEQFNSMATAIKEGKLDVPTLQAQGTAARLQSDYDAEKSFQDMGGPMRSGMARASMAKLTGEQAEGERTNLPQEFQLKGMKLAGELGREGVTEKALDAESVNRLHQATNLDPLVIEKAAVDAKAALGRAPNENEVLDYALKNRMNLEKNVTPVTYENELTKLNATKQASPFVRQSILNSAKQVAAATSQPPSDVTGPMLFRSNPGAQPGDPSSYWRKPVAGSVNPLMIPSVANFQSSMMGRQMGSMMGQPNNTGGGQLIQLPGGGYMPVGGSMPGGANYPATPAPQAVNPSYPSVWTNVANALMRNNKPAQ